eukprot:3728623-Amphidinium_carterae.1
MARVVTLGKVIPTNQITPGSAEVVLEEPVEDHPVRVGVEGVTTLSKPLVGARDCWAKPRTDKAKGTGGTTKDKKGGPKGKGKDASSLEEGA